MNTALIVSLLLVGLVLLLLEITVIPGVGVAGLLGVAALAAGCFLTYSHFGTTVGLIVTLATLVVFIGLMCYVLRAKTWKRLALNDKVEASAGQDSSSVNVGDKAVTATRLAPMGNARFDGKTMEVKSVEGIIDPETAVVVCAVEENVISVKKDII